MGFQHFCGRRRSVVADVVVARFIQTIIALILLKEIYRFSSLNSSPSPFRSLYIVFHTNTHTHSNQLTDVLLLIYLISPKMMCSGCVKFYLNKGVNTFKFSHRSESETEILMSIETNEISISI